MTYKAIRRKSDKHWMTLSPVHKVVQCMIPEYLGDTEGDVDCCYFSDWGCGLDWSLYELITVHVIAEDELPSEDEIIDVVRQYSLSSSEGVPWETSYKAGIKHCYNWLLNKLKS